MVNLSDFYDMLDKADWYYAWSDNGSAYTKGKNQIANLKELAKQSKEHQDLFDRYDEYMFSGDAWKTEKKPKPNRPDPNA